MSRPTGPERTCIATREKKPSSEMVHLVADEAGLVLVDRSGKLDGRGAWITPRRDLVEQIEARPGPLARTLKRDDLVVAGLLDRIRASIAAEVLDYLSLAARSGRLCSGGEQVESAVRAGELAALLTASDASPQSVAQAHKPAPQLPVYTLPLDRDALGRRIGKGARAVVGVRPGGPAAVLVDRLRRIEALR